MTETAQMRAAEVLKRLPVNRPLIGAEVGVYRGDMSAVLLKRPELFLYMIDSWAPKEAQPTAYRDTGDRHALMSLAAQEEHRAAALEATAFAADRRRVMRRTSGVAAMDIPDGLLDFAFIDGDHSYQGVKMDIRAWARKVKPHGVLCGHDYDDPHPATSGVKPAVDEAAKAMGRVLDLGKNYTWFLNL